MNNAQLAKNIKRRCKEKSISVTKFLEECQLKKGFIYDLEKKDKTPSVTAVAKLANVLDCSMDYLLGRETSIVINNFNGHVTIGDIGDKSNVNINVANFLEKEATDEPLKTEFLQEVQRKFESLGLREKAEFIWYMYNFKE